MHALVLAALLLRSTALAPVVSRRGMCERAGAAAAAAWTAARPRSAAAAPPLCDEAVSALANGKSTVYLVGTAHVSDVSARLVAETIDAVRPTLVMVELDGKRRLGAFVVGTVLRSLYKSLERLGLDTGEEFAVALRKARSAGVPVLLADRDVDETLRLVGDAVRKTTSEDLENFEAALSPALAGDLTRAVDVASRDSVASTVELVKKRETVRTIVAALEANAPALYDALVDSPRAHGASRAGAAGPGQRVAVVGMAHEDGIARRLAARGAPAPRRAAARRGKVQFIGT
ncbi:TraB-like protein [Aureococcus anophagefferens]|nr:TraB-like protein [Aureococcus anophagefferens]